MDRLACLDELAALTAEMLVAAQARDEDALLSLDARYRTASAALLALPPAVAGDPDAARIAALAEQIVERQRAVETLVGPWMDDLRVLLRERKNERALAAYRNLG